MRDLGADGSEALFNLTGSTPVHANVPVGQGSVSGNTIKLKIFGGSFGKDQAFAAQECTGTFGSDCTTIDWGPKGCFKGPAANSQMCPVWCAAWTTGCVSPAPWYGLGMSFWGTLGSNMVLQRAPAAAAVYGIATTQATAVNVTVTESSTGVS